jgi:hypothetical protein
MKIEPQVLEEEDFEMNAKKDDNFSESFKSETNNSIFFVPEYVHTLQSFLVGITICLHADCLEFHHSLSLGWFAVWLAAVLQQHVLWTADRLGYNGVRDAVIIWRLFLSIY